MDIPIEQDDQTERAPRLTGKQRAFVNAWFGEAQFNGTEAARLAGYSGGDDPKQERDVWAAHASRTLRNVKVQQEIARRWAKHGMSAEEVLSRLSDQARASIGEFLALTEDGEWYMDLASVQDRGHIIKSIQWTKYGPKIELYDAQGALQLIGRHLGMFTDRIEHTGPEGEPLKLYIGFSPDDWDEDTDDGEV